MSQPSLDIRLKRITKIYYENDIISGLVVIETKQDLSHQGLTLVMSGTVNMELSGKTHGVFEALYQSIKPIPLTQCSLELTKPGKFPSGRTEIPFEIPLKLKIGASGAKRLYETYRGVYITIQYSLTAEMKRTLLQRPLTNRCDFMVQYKEPKSDVDKATQKPIDFSISPDTVHNVKDKHRLPRFLVRGRLNSTEVACNLPITGWISVVSCDQEIKSIEMQLVRVETCGCAEGFTKDSTEIENLQMVEGDVCRGIEVPIYMLLPRLFTCPSLLHTNFKIEFEINIVVVFKNDHLVTETFPLRITRF